MTITTWLVHYGFAMRQKQLLEATERVYGSRYYESPAQVALIFRLGKKLDKWTALLKAELKGE